MPIYEYECSACHNIFEKWLSHVEDNSVTHECPNCQGVAHHIISYTSFALKGGGWYATEYGNLKEKAKSSSGESSSTEVSSSTNESSSSTPAVVTSEAKTTPKASSSTVDKS